MFVALPLQELRKQLESQVLKIEALQNEKREAVECHQNVCFLIILSHPSLITKLFGLLELHLS